MDQRRRDAGPRGVVNKHPVVVARAEFGQRIAGRCSTDAWRDAPPQRLHGEAQAGEAARVEMRVVGRDTTSVCGEFACTHRTRQA